MLSLNDFERFIDPTENSLLPKVIESYSVEDWEILTDDGWVDIEEIHKTAPYNQWKLVTESNKELIGADLHRVYNEDMQTRYLFELKENDLVQTKDGIEKVVSIKNQGNPVNMYDLTLADNSNHRFYANDILSHNSTNMGIRTILLCNLLPGIKIATIVPRTEQLKTIADKYSETDKAYRFKKTNAKFRDNLYYKEFPHPSGKISIMRLWYILTNADKIRGNRYDGIDYDEYQDFDDTLEPVIKATQSRSDLRFTTYSGTSKTTDSALEARWLESARGMWRLTCPACHYDNYPTIKYGVMDMIQPKGLCCKKCGRLLNVREGHWDFEAPEMLKLGHWGFHIPQVIVPANTENPNIWIDIYRSSKTMEKKFFYEEFLGEATEEGSRELTAKDLQRICTLGSLESVQREALDPTSRKYKMFLSGCDWGGSDWNPASNTKESYTVHTIVGVLPNGNLDIVYSHTYAGMMYEEICQCIAKAHHTFHCSAIAGDFGGGLAYLNELKKHIDPLKVISFKYPGSKVAMLTIPPSSQNFGNLYSLNRTESITALFLDIKEGKIRAPGWEYMSRELLQCLNLVRIPVENATGENTLKYEKAGNKPDDFLHSLNYANVLSKLMLGQPLFEDQTKQAMFYNYMHHGTFNTLPTGRKVGRVMMG